MSQCRFVCHGTCGATIQQPVLAIQVEARLTHIDTRLAKGNMELAIRKSGNMALVLPDQPGMAASKFGKTSMFGNEDLDEKRTFGEAVGKAITSEHDLTQIVAVQPDDPFTRPQRLTVMLCLILGQTAVAAIFFGIDPSNIGMKAIALTSLSPMPLTSFIPLPPTPLACFLQSPPAFHECG